MLGQELNLCPDAVGMPQSQCATVGTPMRDLSKRRTERQGGEGRGAGLALSTKPWSKIEAKKSKNSKFDLRLSDYKRIYLPR